MIFDGCPLHDLLAEYYTKEKDLDVIALTEQEITDTGSK